MKIENIHINNLMRVWKANNIVLRPADKKDIKAFANQIASLFSAGSYYYLIMNFETFKLEHISKSIENVLDLASDTFSLEEFLELIHPEDLQKMHEKEQASLEFKLTKISKEDITKYKTVYLLRLKSKDGSYKTMLHQAKVLNISGDGKLSRTITIHTDVTHLNLPIDHKISFISNERPCYYSLDTGDDLNLEKNNFNQIFTTREKQILEEIAKGNSFVKIADELNVSPFTINTHKRNILKKSNCKNTAELITKCIREGVI